MNIVKVTAWGILGSIWNVLEAAMQGLTDASAVRVAYLLGKGMPALAEGSAHKSLFLNLLLSIISTTLLLMYGSSISGWYTSDTTLRRMINEVIPMIGIANIFMATGLVSWELLGAQGRYDLATYVSLVSSWLVTIPLSMLFTFYYNYDLMGITVSIVVGYSTLGLLQAYFLFRSDWEQISKKIQDRNAADSEYDSSSDDDR